MTKAAAGGESRFLSLELKLSESEELVMVLECNHVGLPEYVCISIE